MQEQLKPSLHFPLSNNYLESIKNVSVSENNGPFEFVKDGLYQGIQLSRDKEQCLLAKIGQFGGCVTICVNVKPVGQQKQLATVLKAGTNWNANLVLWYIDGKYQVRFANKSGYAVTNVLDFNLQENAFQTVAIVFDNDQVSAYVNGHLKCQWKGDGKLKEQKDCKLSVGATLDGLEEFFKGCVGDIKVFNCCLTTQEILQMSNQYVNQNNTKQQLSLQDIQKQQNVGQQENEQQIKIQLEFRLQKIIDLQSETICFLKTVQAFDSQEVIKKITKMNEELTCVVVGLRGKK